MSCGGGSCRSECFSSFSSSSSSSWTRLSVVVDDHSNGIGREGLASAYGKPDEVVEGNDGDPVGSRPTVVRRVSPPPPPPPKGEKGTRVGAGVGRGEGDGAPRQGGDSSGTVEEDVRSTVAGEGEGAVGDAMAAAATTRFAPPKEADAETETEEEEEEEAEAEDVQEPRRWRTCMGGISSPWLRRTSLFFFRLLLRCRGSSSTWGGTTGGGIRLRSGFFSE